MESRPAIEKRGAATVLGIDPPYDLFTRDAAMYRHKHVYPYLQSRGLQVAILSGNPCRRESLPREVTRKNTVLLTGSGHGFTDRYNGRGATTLLSVESFDGRELTGTIVHLLACDTACVLGSDLVVKGCTAFFGYAASFDYPAGEESEAVLETFLACDSEIDFALADGCTAEEAYRRAYVRFTLEVGNLTRSHRFYAASLLKDNRDRLRGPPLGTAWGDCKATLGYR